MTSARRLPLWRLTLAIQRRTMEFWNDPRSMRTVLRSRAGIVYDWRRGMDGMWWICKREPQEIY